MKKKCLQSAAFLWMLVLAVSCFDPLSPGEIKEDQTPAEGKMFIRATLEQRVSETKTVLSGQQVSWTQGDKFKVFNASNPDGVVFTLKEEGSGGTAIFEGDIVSGEGPFYYVYPADAATAFSGSSVSMNLPATQTYVANSFALGSCIAAGTSATLESVTFNHVSGVLLLQLKDENSRRISKINVYTKGTENLCGSASVQFSGSVPSLSFTSEQTLANPQCVTLDCSQVEGGGVELSGTATGFYVSLPDGVFSDGFYLEAVDIEGNVMVKYSTANTIEKTHIRRMEAFLYKPQYKEAFLLPSTVEAGGFTGVKQTDASLGISYPYVQGEGQYAYSVQSGTRNLRIQDWSRGFAMTLEVAATETLIPGTTTTNAVSVSVNGSATGSSTMRVLKKVGNRVWLAEDVTTSPVKGYIMFVED